MKFKILITLIFLISSFTFLGSLNTVEAKFCTPKEYFDQSGIECEADDMVPDMTCVLSRILNTPTSGQADCCENKCPKAEDNKDNPIDPVYYSIDIFNTKVEISYEKLPTLINLGFSTFLAIIAIYAALRGIYIFAIKMPNATTDENLASISKEAKAIVIGFILSVSFLFITQLVFNILGLPSLAELQLDVDPTTEVDGPVIVIK